MIIRSAAHISIPQTNTNKFATKRTYWSNQLDALSYTKQSLWVTFKQTRLMNNLIGYKKANSNF